MPGGNQHMAAEPESGNLYGRGVGDTFAPQTHHIGANLIIFFTISLKPPGCQTHSLSPSLLRSSDIVQKAQPLGLWITCTLNPLGLASSSSTMC